MVEDMKGKIRVYCRARPLSGSEKERVRFAISCVKNTVIDNSICSFLICSV